MGPAWLDHHVDSVVAHASGLPRLNPQLRWSIDEKILRVHRRFAAAGASVSVWRHWSMNGLP